jgi:hypothetical protein
VTARAGARQQSHGPFDIAADSAMLDRIVADASANGGDLVPNDHWTLPADGVQTLRLMLDALIGPIGSQPVDEDAVACYEPFLRGIDHLGLCKADLLAQSHRRHLMKSDLGTLMDLNLTAAYLPSPVPDPLRVIEVGGGYGRLAEAFLRLRPGAVRYLLIDAVPASLMYAYLFMKAAFPELRIGSFYAGDEYSDDFDCYVMPAWQTRSLSGVRFDLAINVESMQEMDRRHVDYFLALFDRLTVAEAIVYISNARDYVFKGKWSFPNGWQTLFQHNTPRSWSRNHPTLVFRKGPRDYSVERRVAEAAFAQESAHWNPRLSMLKP